MAGQDIDHEVDMVFIGAGPGGYTGAIRAAQLGFKVACVEKSLHAGGTCLNVGCIPSKALLHASEVFMSASKGGMQALGVQMKDISFDLGVTMRRKEKIIDTLAKGIAFLLKKNAILSLTGKACIEGKGKVSVALKEGGKKMIGCKHIVIATGSSSSPLPGIKIDEKNIVSSTGALSFSKVPEKLMVIGAGVIGLELGSVWSRLGSKVTVVEFLDHIVSGADKELGKNFQRLLKRQGLEFMLSHKVSAAEVKKDRVSVTVEKVADAGTPLSLEVDKMLVAVGRRPYTEGLGLENVGVTPDKRGFIPIDAAFQTSSAEVYAIGDCVEGPMLAHKAEEEGVALAEILAGHRPIIDHLTIPSIIYTAPEMAWVGRTEEALIADKITFKKGVFPFKANSRAVVNDCTEGMVKILAEENTGRVLGVHILGHDAGTLIQEAVSVMAWGGCSDDIARVCHGHPTLNEALKEAAMAVDDRAIHI